MIPVLKRSAVIISSMLSSAAKKDLPEIKAVLSGILRGLENLLQWSGLQNGFWKT